MLTLNRSTGLVSRGRPMKICGACGVDKPESEYYKRKNGSAYSMCKPCNRAKTARWSKRNPERRKASVDKFRAKPEARKRAVEVTKLNIKKKPGIRTHYNALRRTKKSQRTPTWLTPEHKKSIAYFYWLARDAGVITGENYHVDHIVPLNGRNVCGLHVPWNLQVLPEKTNIQKSNKT